MPRYEATVNKLLQYWQRKTVSLLPPTYQQHVRYSQYFTMARRGPQNAPSVKGYEPYLIDDSMSHPSGGAG